MGFIPILMENVEEVRVEAKVGLGKFVILGNALLYTSNIFLFAYYSNLSNQQKMISIFILLSSCMIIMGIGFRGPVAYLILYVLLIRFFLSTEYIKKQRISIRYFLYGLIMIIILALADFIRHGEEISFIALAHIFWTMSVNLYNLENIISYFNINDFYYGKSLIDDFLVAFPGSDTKFFGVVLKDLIQLDFKGEGMTVTAPGEGYANGGYIGVILHATFLGLLYGSVYNVFSKKQQISYKIILLIIVISFSKVVVSGITPTFIFTLGPILFFSIILIILTRKKNENSILCKT
jgi:oligosaccharide repeat unit polymerase